MKRPDGRISQTKTAPYLAMIWQPETGAIGRRGSVMAEILDGLEPGRQSAVFGSVDLVEWKLIGEFLPEATSETHTFPVNGKERWFVRADQK